MSLESGLLIGIVAGAIRVSTPLVFAGLGELIYERSGVINLGLEGLMLIGALAAVWAQTTWHNSMVAIVFALCVSAAIGLVHGVLCVKFKTNQIATGVALVILCQGLTAFWGKDLVGQRIVADLSLSGKVPFPESVMGRIISQQDVLVLAAIPCVLMVWFFLFRTHWGIMLRAAGESAQSARALGIPVVRIRLIASMVCGGFCGLGGAHLSLAYASQWQEDMVSGRGWIALVLVIFSRWKPSYLLLAAYLFGTLTALQLNLQGLGIRVSSYLLGMIPFVLSISVLVITQLQLGRKPTGMPQDLGKPF